MSLSLIPEMSNFLTITCSLQRKPSDLPAAAENYFYMTEVIKLNLRHKFQSKSHSLKGKKILRNQSQYAVLHFPAISWIICHCKILIIIKEHVLSSGSQLRLWSSLTLKWTQILLYHVIFKYNLENCKIIWNQIDAAQSHTWCEMTPGLLATDIHIQILIFLPMTISD